MEDALRVENLTKDYGEFKLNNISFNLPKGTIMGFIGENGAGKTTTIKLILNMIKKNGGDIQILGRDNITHEQQLKQQIGVVTDENHFNDNLRPLDISSIMKHIYTKWNDSLFKKYLKRFGIPETRTLKEMSKGTKMKLSISTALAHNPKLLILDEATSGLDPVIRNEILDIFLDVIQDEERSIFLSTHITSDLEKIADYITLIHNGEIMFSKTKDELIDNYGILRCGRNDYGRIEQCDIAGCRKGQFGYEIFVENKAAIEKKYKSFIIDPANIEDIMLFYVRSDV